MSKINFEEYRQPWETGNHWELKREFLEKYQDDFPEDRLLCLAQAYSNIELMHCSYPDPVMFQIHELSKPLKGCKRFREANKNVSKNEPELQARPPGKRSAPDDFKKPFKFIKFTSVGTQFSKATEQLSSENNVPEISLKPNINLEGPSNMETAVCVADTLTNNPITVESTSTQKSDNLVFEEFEDTNYLMSIHKSPNLKLINDLAVMVKTNKARKKIKQPIRAVQEAAKDLKVQNQVIFKIVEEKKKRSICELYVGGTLMSIGRDTNVKTAQNLAADSVLDTLQRIENLPHRNLNDLKKDVDEQELGFLKTFTEAVIKDTKQVSLIDKIQSVSSQLKSLASFFTVRDDLKSALHHRKHICDFVIKNVLISQTKAFNKKNAKEDAATRGIKILAQYFNIECKDMILETNNFKKEKKSKPQTKKESDSEQKTANTLNTPCTEQEKSPIITGPFRINHKLMENSLRHQFAILDNNAISPVSQRTPRNILNYSMQFCKKPYSYEVPEPTVTESGLCYRCDVMLEDFCIGSGEGATKNESKLNATTHALHRLQSEFYTIVVKNETEDGFFIRRNQLINIEAPTNAVSESNIGCKMLKMMGWTGGALGTNGITEPITATEHRFHQGLGFASVDTDKKKFRQKVDSLLREFSHTETTCDLIFGIDFTKEERKEIHRIADRFGLLSSSRGKNENRQLFVRHKFTVTEILNHLISSNGRTSKYELVDYSSRVQMEM